MKLGDAVSVPAQLVAHGVDWVFDTDLEHCVGCGRRKHSLNDFSDAVYDWFWRQAHINHQESLKNNA